MYVPFGMHMCFVHRISAKKKKGSKNESGEIKKGIVDAIKIWCKIWHIYTLSSLNNIQTLFFCCCKEEEFIRRIGFREENSSYIYNNVSLLESGHWVVVNTVLLLLLLLLPPCWFAEMGHAQTMCKPDKFFTNNYMIKLWKIPLDHSPSITERIPPTQFVFSSQYDLIGVIVIVLVVPHELLL